MKWHEDNDNGMGLIVNEEGRTVALVGIPEERALILAAPDLLEACKAAVMFVDGGGNDLKTAMDIWDGLREVVAKAEGK